MTDKQKIKAFAKSLGLITYSWAEPQYIMEAARLLGAVESLVLGSSRHDCFNLNFELDKKGTCIGYSTEKNNSFTKRGKK